MACVADLRLPLVQNALVGLHSRSAGSKVSHVNHLLCFQSLLKCDTLGAQTPPTGPGEVVGCGVSVGDVIVVAAGEGKGVAVDDVPQAVRIGVKSKTLIANQMTERFIS